MGALIVALAGSVLAVYGLTLITPPPWASQGIPFWGTGVLCLGVALVVVSWLVAICTSPGSSR